ncbi:MAG: hypothetical protein CL441_06545, partial [Acidimicrobiaceae bacterium]|nr:hypothetical protein [Acidimicrobiaceae bacterium]
MTRASSGVLTVATLVASASLSGCVIHLNGAICNESEPRAEELSLGDATGVRVEARAGSLRVEGSADDLIKATGTACAA